MYTAVMPPMAAIAIAARSADPTDEDTWRTVAQALAEEGEQPGRQRQDGRHKPGKPARGLARGLDTGRRDACVGPDFEQVAAAIRLARVCCRISMAPPYARRRKAGVRDPIRSP